MLKGLADLLDAVFRPINALFQVGTGTAPPDQGGNVAVGQPVEGSITKLVDRLPVWAEIGAPSLLERLRVPSPTVSTPAGPAPIALSGNEVRKPLTLEEAAWRASA
jgi:hypothetical protein